MDELRVEVATADYMTISPVSYTSMRVSCLGVLLGHSMCDQAQETPASIASATAQHTFIIKRFHDSSGDFWQPSMVSSVDQP